MCQEQLEEKTTAIRQQAAADPANEIEQLRKEYQVNKGLQTKLQQNVERDYAILKDLEK